MVEVELLAKRRESFNKTANGLYLRSKNARKVIIAKAILSNIKLTSGSLSQIDGIVKLWPLMEIIKAYFDTPKEFRQAFVEKLEENAVAFQSNSETRLVKALSQ